MANATAHPRVYLLADHLDAILSCGEDLLSTPPLSVSDETASTVSSPNDRRSFVETMRTLEVRIVSRVLMARDLADAVRRTDRRFTPMADMFQSGTVPLADAAAELADSTGPDFLTGNDAIAYLRSRGLIAADAPGLGPDTTLTLTEDLLLAGHVPLGPLLDLVSAFLDALEAHYDLFEPDAAADAETEQRREIAAAETATDAVP